MGQSQAEDVSLCSGTRERRQKPSRVVLPEPVCLRGLQIPKSGGRKLGQVIFQGPTWFSNLTINARAQRPWKTRTDTVSSPGAHACVIFSQGAQQPGRVSVTFSDPALLETTSDLQMSWQSGNLQLTRTSLGTAGQLKTTPVSLQKAPAHLRRTSVTPLVSPVQTLNPGRS